MAARHGVGLATCHEGNTRVIGEVFGGAMGLLLALSPLLYLLAGRNDRRAVSERNSLRAGLLVGIGLRSIQRLRD